MTCFAYIPCLVILIRKAGQTYCPLIHFEGNAKPSMNLIDQTTEQLD
ncbi:MAG: hypothetical protein J7M14_04595 [Planctomycetes bacterium]|nr:hypothetical protein [Planctomycetota bacterium]